jgi:hypothetical protein
MTGVVRDFDVKAGEGHIEVDGRLFYFHCVSIADGTRTVPVGAMVRANVMTGHLGRDEACDVVVL